MFFQLLGSWKLLCELEYIVVEPWNVEETKKLQDKNDMNTHSHIMLNNKECWKVLIKIILLCLHFIFSIDQIRTLIQ